MTKRSLSQLALAALAYRAGVPPDPIPPEFSYLLENTRGLPEEQAEFSRLVDQALRKPSSEDAALVRLAEAWQLSPPEVLALALAALVERDLMCGRALAFLQAPIGGARPTLGLLTETFGWLNPRSPLNAPRFAQLPVFLSGTLALQNEGSTLPERSVAAPLPICLALNDEEGTWPGGVIDEGANHVSLPESVLKQCQRHATALQSPPAPVLVLRSNASEETRAAAALIAHALHKRAFIAHAVNPAGLAAWLLLRDLVPVFLLEPGPGETKTVPVIPLYDGPIIVACGVEGTIDAPGREVTTWTLPLPTLEERETLWRATLPQGTAAAELARSHRLSSARIAQLGKLARHRAHLEGLPAPTAETVRAVSRSGEGAGLESLAQLVSDPVPDNALVLSPELRAELEALLARCHFRDGLTQNLGAAASARYTAGVRALFVGPAGTGKTLAACWIATRLGLPLYRVDLANITSKYIGETEKNLAQLLARAESSEAVLLFDEADSLFGKRTDIRDSNDRFANTQTNYLLQRIETFDSIAILTSNSRGRFDTAFSRRLDMVIEFPAPAPSERRSLWQAHLGTAHALSVQELNLIAGQCDFAGGQIRNVVLSAAVSARANGQIIDFSKLVAAMQAEYRKAGRPMPPGLNASRPMPNRK